MDSRSREKSAADTQVEASSEIFSEEPYVHLLLNLVLHLLLNCVLHCRAGSERRQDAESPYN